MRQLTIALVPILLVACLASKIDLPTPTTSPFISEQQAIKIAIESATTGHPEMGPTGTSPTNIQAELITLASAVDKQSGQREKRFGYDPNMMVWYVTMDGLWTDEFPRPKDVPPGGSLYHFSVIIDARTGQEMGIAASR